MKYSHILLAVLLDTLSLNQNLTLNPDIKISASLMNDGYYFKCEVISSNETLEDIHVTFDGVSVVDIKKTENRSFTFTLDRSKGILEYEGYKNLFIKTKFDEISEINKRFSILGKSKHEENIASGDGSVVYIYDENKKPILMEKFEIREESGAVFPTEVNFKMKNFMSLYADPDTFAKLSFVWKFGDVNLKFQPLYINDLEKYTFISDEIKFMVDPGLYKSQFLITFNGFVEVDFIYDYDVYFKKVIGDDIHSNYRLIIGEK